MRRLKDKKTPKERLGLYASMLGECGTASDAQFLRSMLAGFYPDCSTIEGILTGYLKLQPKEAWSYIQGVVFGGSRIGSRFGALGAMEFIVESRPDLLDKADIARGIATMLSQEDIADFVIEDLRQWQCWDMTGKVLAVYERKSENQKLIRRMVLRFALSAQAVNAKAAAFIAAERKRDPGEVTDVQENLAFERNESKLQPSKQNK
jgi:hypothetical protein